MGFEFFAMAILGCGDAGTTCQEARVADKQYSSVAECMADMDNQLMLNTDLDYPVIMGECRLANPRLVNRSSRRPG